MANHKRQHPTKDGVKAVQLLELFDTDSGGSHYDEIGGMICLDVIS
jgi:hypothetical protein